MARFLVEILASFGGGAKVIAGVDDIGNAFAASASKIDASSLKQERSIRRVQEAAEKLKEQMQETNAAKGLVADYSALNKKLDEQIQAYHGGEAALARYEQKQKEAAQAQRILSAQVKAGVSAESEIGKKIAEEIRLNDKLQAELRQTQQARAGANAQAAESAIGGSFFSGLAGAAAKITAVYASVLALRSTITHLTSAASESEAAFAQLQAGVTSTGGAARYTVRQLDDMATQISHLTGKDDELVSSGEAVLLTFTRIRGGRFFDAMSDAMDVSVRKGVDLQSAVQLVGKMYSGSIESAKKAGIVLSDQQKKQIKDLFDTGHAIEAQIKIHELLQRAVGGSAAAYRNTLGGALEAAKTETGNLVEIIAGELSPAIRSLVEDYIKWAISADTQREMAHLGHEIAVSIDGIVSIVKVATPALQGLYTEFKLTLEVLSTLLRVLGWVADKVDFARRFWVDWASSISGVSVDITKLSFDFETIDHAIDANISTVVDLRKAYGDLTAAQLESAKAGVEAMTSRRDALLAEMAQLRSERADLQRRNPGVVSNTNRSSNPFSVGGQASAEASAKLNDLLARERDLSEEGKNLSNIIEYSNKRLEGHSKAAKAAADEEGGLSDKLRKAYENLKKMMDALEQEAQNRTDLLNALRRGTEAYREEQRAQAIDAELTKARLIMQEAGIKLSDANAAAIRRWAGALFDTNYETEKFNTLLSSVESALKDISGVVLPDLKIGSDISTSKDWAKSLTDLGFGIDHLRYLLAQMPKDSEQYKTALVELTAREHEYQEQSARMPQILHDRDVARTSEISSVLLVGQTIKRTIQDEIDALGRGSVAWDRYQRDIEARAQALQILGAFKLPKPDASDTQALAEWHRLFDQYNKEFAALARTISIRMDADTAAKLRESLKTPRQIFKEFGEELDRLVGEHLLSEQEAKILLARANEFLSSLREGLKSFGDDINKSLVNAVVGAAFEGKDAWEEFRSGFKSALQSLISDWLSAWVRAMGQWLRQWIATQMAAKGVQAGLGSGSGGGGGVGTVASSAQWYQWAAGKGGGGGGMAGLWGSAGASGAGSGSGVAGLFSGTGSAGALGMVGAWVAALAVFAIGINKLNDHLKGTKEEVIEFSNTLDIKLGQGSSGGSHLGGLVAAGKAMADEIKKFFSAYDAIFEGLDGSIGIKKRGQGKHTEWKVYIDGVVKNFGNDMEAAMNYAMVEALKKSKSFGLDPIVQQAIKNSTAKTIEEFQKQIAAAVDIADIGRTDAGRQIDTAFSSLRSRMETIMSSLTGGTDEFIDALSRTVQDFVQSARSTYNQLRGIQEDPAVAEERMRLDYNARVTLAHAQLVILKAETDAKILGINVTRTSTRTYIESLAEMGRAAGNFAAISGNISEEMLAALEAESEALAQALANLPPLINPGEMNPGGGNHGGSGTNKADLRKDLRDEIARLRAESMGDLKLAFIDLQQQIADFTKRAKEAKLPPAELAEAVALMTAKLKKSIEDQKNAYAGIGTDFTKRLQEMLDFFKQVHDLQPNKGKADPREQQARDRMGKELESMLAQFNGLVDPMASINLQADTLRQNVIAYGKAMGWTAQQIQDALDKITSGINYQRQSAINGIMGKLFEYLKDDVSFTKDKQAFEKQMLDLDFTLMEAQLKALGALDDATQRIFNAAHDAATKMVEAAGAITKAGESISHPGGWTEPITPGDLLNAAKEAAKAWQDGIKQFTESTRDLLTNDQLTGLSQDQQLEVAKARWIQTEAAAKAGDVQALARLDQVRQEYLSEAHDSFQGGFGFLDVWKEVMGDSADFLSNAKKGEQSAIQIAIDSLAANDNDNTTTLAKAIYDSASQVASAIYAALSGVPKYAEGGLVQHRHFALVGEKGPEAIIPLGKILHIRPPESSMAGLHRELANSRLLIRGDSRVNQAPSVQQYGTTDGKRTVAAIDQLAVAQSQSARRAEDSLEKLAKHAASTARSNEQMSRQEQIKRLADRRGR